MTYTAIYVNHKPYRAAVQGEDSEIVAYQMHFEDALYVAAALNAAQALTEEGSMSLALTILKRAEEEIVAYGAKPKAEATVPENVLEFKVS